MSPSPEIGPRQPPRSRQRAASRSPPPSPAPGTPIGTRRRRCESPRPDRCERRLRHCSSSEGGRALDDDDAASLIDWTRARFDAERARLIEQEMAQERAQLDRHLRLRQQRAIEQRRGVNTLLQVRTRANFPSLVVFPLSLSFSSAFLCRYVVGAQLHFTINSLSIQMRYSFFKS